MSTFDDISQERQRIADRLGKLDAERARLAEQLTELETTERVLSRFSKSASDMPRRRGRPRSDASVPSGNGRKSRPRRNAQAVAAKGRELSLADATLRAVQAHTDGASAEEVRNYLAREFEMQVRPNHLGMALQRHRRAGRLDNRDSRWRVSADAGSAGGA
ncbi:MAG: hypothetical protein JO038_09025 [Alphaproteobacteria bacterium]|nr:hypothetical protein [Alphaproteobacteria bacterium]